MLLIATYKTFLSGIFGGHCRFTPSCSEYAEQCFRTLLWREALKLTARRLCRCHPLGDQGYDPVPNVYNNGVSKEI